MTWDPRVLGQVNLQPDPLLYLTVSGAHLYGFPSPDSDYDLRGVHVRPLNEALGLNLKQETREVSHKVDGLEIDLVTHDVKTSFSLMLKKNGNILEYLYSPLVVHTTPEHQELKAIAQGCITRFHAYHYLGFSENQWQMFDREWPRRVKPLLYVFRVLLTGLNLLRTGEVEANLLTLNEETRLSYINDLVARKLNGPEQAELGEQDVEFFRSEYHRLRGELEEAMKVSKLPEKATTEPQLNSLLIRIRKQFG